MGKGKHKKSAQDGSIPPEAGGDNGWRKKLGRAMSFTTGSGKSGKNGGDNSPAAPLTPSLHPNPPPPPSSPIPDTSYTSEQMEGIIELAKKARGTLVLRKNLAEKWIRPRAEAKEALKTKLDSKVTGSMGDLKTKVKNTKHQAKVSEIEALIRDQLDGLAFKPT